jgi:hypothetical protein
MNHKLRVLTLNVWGLPYISKCLEFRLHRLKDDLQR